VPLGTKVPQLSSVEAKDDISQYKQLMWRMIRELEEVLVVL
jgi:hypothetical protein